MAAVAAAGPKTYRIETVAGSADMGDGGPALSAQIGNIQGVAVDAAGNLYLSDTDRHCVRKVDTQGIITTIAGTGTAGFSGDGGPASTAQLNFPYGLAAGPAGELYVADLGNNRVRRIGPDGGIATVAGRGSPGTVGEGGLAVEAALLTPRNVAVDAAGNLYISEFEGHRVRKVVPDGRITTVAGTGTRGFSGDGGFAILAQIAFPAGLAVDSSGTLFIADSQNQRLRRVTPGGIITTLLGGIPGSALQTPTAVGVNRDGAVYVLDQSFTIRCYKPAPAWITVAGTGTALFSGDGGRAVRASLLRPNDLAVSVSGDVYIADGTRIRRVDTDGLIATVAGDAYVHAVGDGQAAIAARLFQPSSVAVDPSGTLYIADPGAERVRRVATNGVMESVFGTGTPGFTADGGSAGGSPAREPMGVAVDANGALLVAETRGNRIRRISADRVSTIAGTSDAGAGAEGKPGVETALRAPRGLCVDRDNATYVVDTGNHRVLRVPPKGPVILVAGSGEAGDGGDGGPARGALLNHPSACAVDASGNLLIADTLNHRIRQVAPNGFISTVAGTGIQGASGDEGFATGARLSVPTGVAIDGAGSIFISDTGNHRIRHVTPQGVIYTVAGGAVPGFAGDTGLATAALLNAPGGLQLDASGNIYFADTGNHRVRRLLPQAEPAAASLIDLSVLNAASLLPGPIAPGELLVIFGMGLGPEEGLAGTFDAAGRLATNVGGTEVRFDDVAAPILYAQFSQVNVQVPYTVAGALFTKMEILHNGRSVAALIVDVKEASPALFPVATNPDGSPNSSTEPAPRGALVTVYATGEGLSDGINQEGQITGPPYPRPKLPLILLVGGVGTVVDYAGTAPGMVGVLQVNARMPGDYIPSGLTPMVLTVGSASSPVAWIWLR